MIFDSYFVALRLGATLGSGEASASERLSISRQFATPGGSGRLQRTRVDASTL